MAATDPKRNLALEIVSPSQRSIGTDCAAADFGLKLRVQLPLLVGLHDTPGCIPAAFKKSRTGFGNSPHDWANVLLKSPLSGSSSRPEKAQADLPFRVPSSFFRLFPFPVISPAKTDPAPRLSMPATKIICLSRVFLADLFFILLPPPISAPYELKSSTALQNYIHKPSSKNRNIKFASRPLLAESRRFKVGHRMAAKGESRS